MNLSPEEQKIILEWPIGRWGDDVTEDKIPLCEQILQKELLETVDTDKYNELNIERLDARQKAEDMVEESSAIIFRRGKFPWSENKRKIKIGYFKNIAKAVYLDARCFRLFKRARGWFFPNHTYIGLSKTGLQINKSMLRENPKFIKQEKKRLDVRKKLKDDDFLFFYLAALDSIK